MFSTKVAPARAGRRTAETMEANPSQPAAHIPVMLPECMRLLNPRPGETVVDGTLGLAGHALAIAEALGEDGHLIGVDRDPRMSERARARLVGTTAGVVCGNFSDLDSILRDLGCGGVDGILLDLGVASPQIDDAGRGFSYRGEGPLDMRMTPGEGPSAAEWLKTASEEEIARVIWEYGDERLSRRIARAIVKARAVAEIRSTGELAETIRRAVPSGRRRLHPARRSFQAIRIFINREITHLERFLRILPGLLKPGGRCVIVSYHSLEDRPVKNAFRAGAREGVYEILTPKPLRASAAEVRSNPRSRSAKLRAVRRMEGGAAG